MQCWQVTSSHITRRLLESEQTELEITSAREKYRVVATRGSIMYFVVANLADIDPMYQYSLKYFSQLFNTCIEQSLKSDNLQARLTTLLENTSSAVYTNIARYMSQNKNFSMSITKLLPCRGLFEKHKLLYSFMLCAEIMRGSNDISDDEWNFFLRGATAVDKVQTTTVVTGLG